VLHKGRGPLKKLQGPYKKGLRFPVSCPCSPEQAQHMCKVWLKQDFSRGTLPQALFCVKSVEMIVLMCMLNFPESYEADPETQLQRWLDHRRSCARVSARIHGAIFLTTFKEINMHRVLAYMHVIMMRQSRSIHSRIAWASQVVYVFATLENFRFGGCGATTSQFHEAAQQCLLMKFRIFLDFVRIVPRLVGNLPGAVKNIKIQWPSCLLRKNCENLSKTHFGLLARINQRMGWFLIALRWFAENLLRTCDELATNSLVVILY